MMMRASMSILLAATTISTAQAAADCRSHLVGISTGRDDSCPSSAPVHYFPVPATVGVAYTGCHAWGGFGGGREHLNSASGMKCIDANTFTFVQYAGNLECNGQGVTKTFTAGECEQDMPPTLYSIPFDLSCCRDPNSCKVGLPSVHLPDSTIYLDGETCAEEANGDAATAVEATNEEEAAAETNTDSDTNTNTDSNGGAGKCCADGSVPVSDGDHNTPPCADGSRPSTDSCAGAKGPATSGSNSGATGNGNGDSLGDGSSSATGAAVTVSTYTDAECTKAVSTDRLEVSAPCNVLPKAAVTDVSCAADSVSYTNWPNSHDCTDATNGQFPAGVPSTLAVGVCQEFPGPVRTWKKIDAAGYTCAGDYNNNGNSNGNGNGAAEAGDRASVDPRCIDSDAWFKKNKQRQTCAWVAKKASQRCKTKGQDGTQASVSCPVACSTCPAAPALTANAAAGAALDTTALQLAGGKSGKKQQQQQQQQHQSDTSPTLDKQLTIKPGKMQQQQQQQQGDTRPTLDKQLTGKLGKTQQQQQQQQGDTSVSSSFGSKRMGKPNKLGSRGGRSITIRGRVY